MILIKAVIRCDARGCKNHKDVDLTLERRESGKYRIDPDSIVTPDGWSSDDWGDNRYCPFHKHPESR